LAEPFEPSRFEPSRFEPERFEPERFEPERFEPERFEPEVLAEVLVPRWAFVPHPAELAPFPVEPPLAAAPAVPFAVPRRRLRRLLPEVAPVPAAPDRVSSVTGRS
jgi:hypothetical protein